MKKEQVFIFFISFFMFFEMFSQKNTSKEIKNEENTQKIYPQTYGFRLGGDISKIARAFFDKDYKGLELVADYRYNFRYYLAGELGFERKTTDTEYFNFTTNGQYIKLGVDYNSYENWYGMQNMIYFGGRYGFSVFSQNFNSYTLHTRNNYWQEDILGGNPQILTNFGTQTAHWLEFVLGLKVELFKNFYAGASVRLSKILYQSKNGIPNFYIPSVGRVWEDSTYGVSYNYTLSYLIPFYKKRNKK